MAGAAPRVLAPAISSKYWHTVANAPLGFSSNLSKHSKIPRSRCRAVEDRKVARSPNSTWRAPKYLNVSIVGLPIDAVRTTASLLVNTSGSFDLVSVFRSASKGPCTSSGFKPMRPIVIWPMVAERWAIALVLPAYDGEVRSSSGPSMYHQA